MKYNEKKNETNILALYALKDSLTMPCLLFVAETISRGSNKCLILDLQCEGPANILDRFYSGPLIKMDRCMCMRPELSSTCIIIGLWGGHVPIK